MNIIGINSGRAAPIRIDPGKRRPLADGSAALLHNGTISCALIEERFTRIRYSGGFRASLPACLNYGGLKLEDIHGVAHSTCCDSAWNDPNDILEDIAESCDGIYTSKQVHQLLAGKVHTVDHHESHAALAFAGSGFQRALVVVMDGIGNRISSPGQFDISGSWWRGAFQRYDVYLCEWKSTRMHMEKVHEDSHEPDQIGIGEIYRSVTHYLGWPTYQHAGKTMALAPFGTVNAMPNLRLVDFVPPQSVCVPVENLHNDPEAQINGAIIAAGYKVPKVRERKGSPQEPFLCNLAAIVQRQTEQAIINSVMALVEKYRVRNVAFGGGVAMNCVALGKIIAKHPEIDVYVPPAPADTGQALGNALWLAYANESPLVESVLLKPIKSASLGIQYSQQEVAKAVELFLARNEHMTGTQFDDEQRLIAEVTNDLLAGLVVGLRQGRSEYGPRALGHASIIADPRSREMHDKVNKCKTREEFRPYAPSILSEYVGEYFEISQNSPFMSFAGIVREEKRAYIPAVVHIDGSARYQSVEEGSGFYRSLLELWYRESGVPVLLNTSFNRNGEPIVETPDDALDCFEHSGLDVLVLENWRICRK